MPSVGVIERVERNRDGTATLVLRGGHLRRLAVVSPPKNLEAAVGTTLTVDVGSVMIGKTKWADRETTRSYVVSSDGNSIPTNGIIRLVGKVAPRRSFKEPAK